MGIGGCVKGNIKTTKGFVRDLRQKYHGEYMLIGSYEGAAFPHTFQHICGIQFTACAGNMLRGNVKCPCLHKKLMQHSAETHAAQVREKGAFKLVEFIGTKASEENTYKHLVCGKIWKASYRQFLISKHKCPHCTGRYGAKLNTVEETTFAENLKAIASDYSFSEYSGMTKPARFVHSCGHSFIKTPSELLRFPACPSCQPRNLTKLKAVKAGNKVFKLQGYEEHALKRLLVKYTPEEIYNSRTKLKKSFKYSFEGKQFTYNPDFWVPVDKLIVEVKSMATLGMLNDMYTFFGEKVFERNQAKAIAVRSKGYKFRLMVYNQQGKLIKLPKGWYNMPKSEVAAAMNVKL